MGAPITSTSPYTRLDGSESSHRKRHQAFTEVHHLRSKYLRLSWRELMEVFKGDCVVPRVYDDVILVKQLEIRGHDDSF